MTLAVALPSGATIRTCAALSASVSHGSSFLLGPAHCLSLSALWTRIRSPLKSILARRIFLRPHCFRWNSFLSPQTSSSLLGSLDGVGAPVRKEVELISIYSRSFRLCFSSLSLHGRRSCHSLSHPTLGDNSGVWLESCRAVAALQAIFLVCPISRCCYGAATAPSNRRTCVEVGSTSELFLCGDSTAAC